MSSTLAAGIQVGHHITATFAGFTFNLDTIWSTALAGLIVIGLGLYMRRSITHGVPSKLQLTWETVVDYVEREVRSNVGPRAPYVVPLAVTLFFFILIANWLELIPTGHKIVAPTADVNLTYALGLFVVLWSYADGVRRLGAGAYIKGLFKPYAIMFPINVIDELMRPFTLALRLFGNMFAGGLMLTLLALLPAYILWLPQAGWRLFDMFIGLIQAFIFALLTILYFGMATSSEH